MLASMMQESWAENPNPPLRYTQCFLRSIFEYPGSTFALAPTVYKMDQKGILGFVAGFPRFAVWEGKPTKLVLISFLTAAKSVKGSGLGLLLLVDLVNRAREEGFDGVINFCVEGDGMDKCMPYFSRAMCLNTERIFTVNYLVRLLHSKGPLRDERIDDSDIDLFLELSANINADVKLSRVWSRAEADWQCRERAGSITISLRNGQHAGMITGYIMEDGSNAQVRVAILDDILWGDLSEAEREQLLDRFLRVAAFRGARIATCPVLGCASLTPLESLRFRRSGRVLHTYLTLWNGMQPSLVEKLYLDIL